MPCLGWGTLNATFADFLNLGTLGVFLFLLVKHRQESWRLEQPVSPLTWRFCDCKPLLKGVMRSFFQQCEVFSFLILNGSEIALPGEYAGWRGWRWNEVNPVPPPCATMVLARMTREHATACKQTTQRRKATTACLLCVCFTSNLPPHKVSTQLCNFFHSVQGLPQGLLQVGSPFVQKAVQDSAILTPQLDHWGRIQGSRWWVLHVVWAIGAMAVLHSTTAFVKAIKDWKFDSMAVWSRGWSVLTGGDEAKHLINVVSKLYWLWKTWRAPKRSGCAHWPPKNRN